MIFDTPLTRRCVLWLEDTQIRALPKSERVDLANVLSPDWPTAFSAYLARLECPHAYSHETHPLVLEWLLLHATALVCHDVSPAPAPASAPLLHSTDDPRTAVLAPFPRLEAAVGLMEGGDDGDDTAACDARLRRVRMTLDQQRGKRLLARRQRQEARLDGVKGGDGSKDDDNEEEEEDKDLIGTLIAEAYPVWNHERDPRFVRRGGGDETTTDGDTYHADLDRVAAVMRALMVKDCRDLQDKIDHVIVQAQGYTANPKTDARLGRVGR